MRRSSGKQPFFLVEYLHESMQRAEHTDMHDIQGLQAVRARLT